MSPHPVRIGDKEAQADDRTMETGVNDLPKTSLKQFCQSSSILSQVWPPLVHDWNDPEKDLLFSSSRVSLILEESQYKLSPLVCSHVNLLWSKIAETKI